MVKALIRKGDRTTHGGEVLEGFNDYTIQGIPVAGIGHKTVCPLCKGVFPIIQGYGGIIVNGISVALEGHITACGAKLIPSQHEEVVDDGDVVSIPVASHNNNFKSMIDDGVYRPNQDHIKATKIATEDDEINPSRFRDEQGQERNLEEWGYEQNYNKLLNAIKTLVPRYSVIRDPDKPYTQEDVEAVKRDYEKAQQGKLYEQRLQSIEKTGQENQNNPLLQFKHFDRQDLLKQSECSPHELENNLSFFEGKGYVEKGATENFRKTGKWPENLPIPARSSNLTPQGNYDWSQTPKNGFLLDSEGNPIQEPVMPKAGDKIDRYGGEGGYFVSPMNDSNNPTPYEQRSLPYMKDPSAYHRYQFNDDMSNFQKWVESSDPQTREDIEDYMIKKDLTYTDLVRKGTIAPAFGQSGGGTQYEFKIPLSLLRKSGILTEISN